MLRSKPFQVIVASVFVLLQGDIADAQTKPAKPSASSATTKKGGGPDKPGGKAAPAAPVERRVCARPKDVDEKHNKWTFDETRKPVVDNIEQTARLTGNRIYIFDEKAKFDSVTLMPAPHNEVRCKGDKGPPPPRKKAPGLIPESRSLIGSSPVIGPSSPFFSSGSFGSSGTNKAPPNLVQQFTEQAASYKSNGSPESDQAKNVATHLADSILNKNSLGEISDKELTPAAAALLRTKFGDSIAAAMAQQPVIGPVKALQALVPSGSNAQWHVLPLVTVDAMHGWNLNSPDTFPAVILNVADYEYWVQILNKIKRRLPVELAIKEYKHAYGDKPDWFAAIEDYFQ